MIDDFSHFVFQESIGFQSDQIEVISLSVDFAYMQISQKGHEDLLKTFLVALACLVYMTFYMGSIFLSSGGILTILMSIPVSMLIYKKIFAVYYFSSIHIAVVIIVIGIGADDIFVFHDTWCQAMKIRSIRRNNLKVITYTTRKSASAMFLTSFTSTMAFAACSFSDVMPIKAFGIFASILVPVVFLLTLISQPFAYFIYMNYISGPRQAFIKNVRKTFIKGTVDRGV